MPRPYGRARRLLARMSEATSGPLNPRLAALMRATAFGSIRQRLLDLVESGCFVVLARYEQTMNKSLSAPPAPQLAGNGSVRLADRQNEPEHTHFGRTNPNTS